MIKIKRKLFEIISGHKCEDNIRSLGIDTATNRTGFALAEVKGNYIEIDVGYINIDSKDLYKNYDFIIEYFDTFLKNKEIDRMIIEDTFFFRNVATFRVLSRAGMILYVLGYFKGIPRKFIMACSARANLKFNGTAKKEIVHQQFRDRLKVELDDSDIIDACILSLTGIINE
jgi:Holliday junction resolvasome RuvABC endonuclease subunit